MPIVIDYNPVRQLAGVAQGAGYASGMANRQRAGMQDAMQIMAYNQHQQAMQNQQDQQNQDRQMQAEQMQNHLLQQNYENQFQQSHAQAGEADKQQQFGIEGQRLQEQQVFQDQKRHDEDQRRADASTALDQAHATGKISDEDYQRAKVNLLSGDRSPFGAAGGGGGDGISGDGLGQARLDLHVSNQAIGMAKYRVQLAAQALRQMQSNNRFKYAPEGSPEKAQFMQAQQDYMDAKGQFDQLSAGLAQRGAGAGAVQAMPAPDFSAVGGSAGGADFGPGSQQPQQVQQAPSQMPMPPAISTREQYDQLPSGSRFVDAGDGQVKIKR